MELNKWDSRFLKLAKEISYWSKDPKTKVGCVIANDDHNLISIGYNGFPRGVDDHPDYLNDKKTKLLLTIHAEVNAILNANSSLKGATAYVTERPCCHCAIKLIQAGIKKVVYLNNNPEDWTGDDQFIMKSFLTTAGVELWEV